MFLRYIPSPKIGEEAKLLEVKVRESGGTQEARATCWSLYEEMIGTLIMKNLPDSIKSAVRVKGLVNLEDLLHVVWEVEQSGSRTPSKEYWQQEPRKREVGFAPSRS